MNLEEVESSVGNYLFDDDTAHKIVVFIGQLLEKAAKGSVKDLLELKNLV